MARKEFNIADYRELMAVYLGGSGGKAKVFFEALDFAEQAHADQLRKSGDPYILHPCNVARILAEEMDIRDPEILAAALLHDTVEDVKHVTLEVIGERFGKNVEAIVDGCTKIAHFLGDKQRFYKVVHRKIFSGAAARLEVMLVKLADRLHNLRTLEAMRRDRRQKISDETLDIYAPMARVMGLFDMKRELYDLALKHKFPKQSNKILAHIRNLENAPEVKEIVSTLHEDLEASWINFEITPRAKGLWGYFDPVNKVLVKAIDHPMEFIILVDDIESCYRVLGLVNQKFPPIPRTIRDFISNPKPTGYQGLHARANIKGRNYLFKIRTPEMARTAQRGIIKAWSEHKPAGQFEKTLREMFDLLGTDEGLSPREMIAASGKKEIYTFTPKGDRVCLPLQSIVLDFAFQVHTEVGNRCIAAIIKRERVEPDHVLKDGDQVKVILQEKPVLFEPRLQELCKTPRARSGLAKGFRLRRQALAVQIGKVILEQECQRYGLSMNDLLKFKAEILERLYMESIEQLYLNVGVAEVSYRELRQRIMNVLPEELGIKKPSGRGLNKIFLNTLDPAVIKFSACCKPNPTEKDLIGILNERGISVHQKTCERFRSLKVRREDVVMVSWMLKETMITKPQHLYIPEATRNRIFMMMAVAPDKMKIADVLVLSRIDENKPAWEINFEVANLHGLKSILSHINKSNLDYEFVIEQ
ncbi:MAG: bifunctional (p)ppGpp synthetase/guanosine-3',5'-bis(diphosphate) 3'-pyrophosphohydrolase [Deltaproteobacteria bacterium]|jgi:GTP pyrophosphokinase|nr:bifunctional (p)ppGpp synthetase/guanosine-3',5'-bis(diphosphate) 3'-pyrophosphohydrolase [Deltaproteobacteria bacterium]